MPVRERLPVWGAAENEAAALPHLYSAESMNGPRENIVTVAHNNEGVFGIFESRDGDDSYAPSRAAGILRNNLLQNNIDTVNPEEAMQETLKSINNDLKIINSAENKNHAIKAAAVKIFKNSDGELQVAYGISGNMQIYHQTAAADNPNHLISRAISPRRSDDMYLDGLYVETLQYFRDTTGVVNVTPGDRLIIVSSGIEEGEGPQLHESVIEIENIDRATRSIVQHGDTERGKVALGVQVGERAAVAHGDQAVDPIDQAAKQDAAAERHRSNNKILAWLGGTALGSKLLHRFNRQQSNERKTESVVRPTTQYPPRLEPGITPIIVPNYPPRLDRPAQAVPSGRASRVRTDVPQGRFGGVRSGWSDFRRHYHDAVVEKKKDKTSGRLGRVGLLGAAGWAAYEGWDHDRRMKWYERQRLHPRYANTTMTAEEVDYDIEQRRLKSVGRVAVGIVAGLILYRLAFDIGDGRNKGIDLMPSFLIPGKNEKGDGWGLDLNWSNRSPVLNDDPTVGHWNSSGAMDLLPSWIDGDPMDPFHWPWTHDTHFQYVPGSSGHVPKTVPPSGGGTHPPTNTPPPVKVPPVIPPQPTGTQPADSIYIEPGSGFEPEIQEYAASEGKPISGSKAYRIFLEGRQRFGDNGMVTGVPLYTTPSNDLRFATPGNAHLTAQMEQLIDSSV